MCVVDQILKSFLDVLNKTTNGIQVQQTTSRLVPLRYGSRHLGNERA